MCFFNNVRTETMKYATIWGLGLLVVALAVTGCSNQPTGTPKADEKKDSGKKDDHPPHGNGPNDGVTFDMGKYHAEFTVDHPKKECTVLFLKEVKGKKEKEWPLEPVDAKEFSVVTKETKVKEGADKGKVVPPMTIALKPVDAKDGKASKFVGTDPGLGNVADFEGTVLGEIGGKPSQGEFKE